jgi:hypothetical protein
MAPLCPIDVADAVASVEITGFFALEDDAIGQDVSRFHVEGFLLQSAHGAQFIAGNTTLRKVWMVASSFREAHAFIRGAAC